MTLVFLSPFFIGKGLSTRSSKFKAGRGLRHLFSPLDTERTFCLELFLPSPTPAPLMWTQVYNKAMNSGVWVNVLTRANVPAALVGFPGQKMREWARTELTSGPTTSALLGLTSPRGGTQWTPLANTVRLVSDSKTMWLPFGAQ